MWRYIALALQKVVKWKTKKNSFSFGCYANKWRKSTCRMLMIWDYFCISHIHVVHERTWIVFTLESGSQEIMGLVKTSPILHFTTTTRSSTVRNTWTEFTKYKSLSISFPEWDWGKNPLKFSIKMVQKNHLAYFVFDLMDAQLPMLFCTLDL
jgi:hypothetical protein